MKRGTRLLVGLLGLITALQLFHSYVTFTRHAAETADAHPAELRPKPPGWRERLPSENAPPLEREEQPVRDARGTNRTSSTCSRTTWAGTASAGGTRKCRPRIWIDSRRGKACDSASTIPIGRARRAARPCSVGDSRITSIKRIRITATRAARSRRPAIHAIDARRLQE